MDRQMIDLGHIDLYEIIIIIITFIGAVGTIIFYILNYKYKKTMDIREGKIEIDEKQKQEIIADINRGDLDVKREFEYAKEAIIATAVQRAKEEIRDYIDMGDLDVKRELSYAIRPLCKDIETLERFVFGATYKSKVGNNGNGSNNKGSPF